MRSLRRLVRKRLRGRGRGRTVGHGTRVQLRQPVGQAAAHLSERLRARNARRAHGRVDCAGGRGARTQTIPNRAGTHQRAIRGARRIPGGQPPVAFRRFRCGLLPRCRPGRSRSGTLSVVGAPCAARTRFPLAGRRASPDVIATFEFGKGRAPHQRRAPVVRTGAPKISRLVRTQMRSLSRHAGGQTHRVAAGIQRHGFRFGGSGRGLRAEQGESQRRHARAKRAGARDVRDSEGGRDRSRRQCRRASGLYEQRQRASHVIRGPSRNLESRRVAARLDLGPAQRTAQFHTGQPVARRVPVPGRLH